MLSKAFVRLAVGWRGRGAIRWVDRFRAIPVLV
jgi:hypothetical protein